MATKTPKYWWIKIRYNPQLGRYVVPCGQITTKRAHEMSKTLYGSNTMIKCESEEAYNSQIEVFKAEGVLVHEPVTIQE